MIPLTLAKWMIADCPSVPITGLPSTLISEALSPLIPSRHRGVTTCTAEPVRYPAFLASALVGATTSSFPLSVANVEPFREELGF